MSFDSKKFLKEKWVPRTAQVSVPDLKDFFPEGQEPVWIVRSLTGHELGRANEAAERNKSMAAIVEGLTASDKEKAGAIKDLLGIGGAIPVDIARRIEHLVQGSVDPVCTVDLVVRLCEVFPIEFFQLTNKIVELTGMGQVPGKFQPSGKTVKSEPASLSVMPEGGSSLK